MPQAREAAPLLLAVLAAPRRVAPSCWLLWPQAVVLLWAGRAWLLLGPAASWEAPPPAHPLAKL